MDDRTLFENTYYLVRSMEIPTVEANYEVVNKMTGFVEANFNVLPSAIEAALILERKLGDCGFSLDQTPPDELPEGVLGFPPKPKSTH